jgi:hypothetical protein
LQCKRPRRQKCPRRRLPRSTCNRRTLRAHLTPPSTERTPTDVGDVFSDGRPRPPDSRRASSAPPRRVSRPKQCGHTSAQTHNDCSRARRGCEQRGRRTEGVRHHGRQHRAGLHLGAGDRGQRVQGSHGVPRPGPRPEGRSGGRAFSSNHCFLTPYFHMVSVNHAGRPSVVSLVRALHAMTLKRPFSSTCEGLQPHKARRQGFSVKHVFQLHFDHSRHFKAL